MSKVVTDQDSNDTPKTLLDKALEINKEYKMISKAEDDSKLSDAEKAISEVIQKIDQRIEEIKSEGAEINDVKLQRELYSEAMQLKHEKDRKSGLNDKLKKINAKLTELSKDQKEFFGIPVKSEGLE